MLLFYGYVFCAVCGEKISFCFNDYAVGEHKVRGVVFRSGDVFDPSRLILRCNSGVGKLLLDELFKT